MHRTIFAAALVCFSLSAAPFSIRAETFLRGDCASGGDVADAVTAAIRLLTHLFADASAPPCLDACDSNDDGALDVSDCVYGLIFAFAGGSPPPTPYPDCGTDLTSDDLDCATPTCTPDDGLPAMFANFLEAVEISVDEGEGEVVLRTDAIPNHPSPYFGVGDPRYEEPHPGMRVNPNLILEQDITFRVPLAPAAATPSDTRLGPIGVTVSGVVLFNRYAAGFTPLDNEIQSFDLYNGHPTGGGQYHHHLEPVFLTASDPAALVAVMLDGFPLYGPEEPDGSAPTGLDDCNGHFGVTPDHPQGIYHYHVVAVEPYFVGCYNGTPGSFTR